MIAARASPRVPRWANPNEWREATDEEQLFAEDCADCLGRCFVNSLTGEMVLCDGADLVLWQHPACEEF